MNAQQRGCDAKRSASLSVRGTNKEGGSQRKEEAFVALGNI